MKDVGEEILIRECIAGNRQYQELLYQKYCRKFLGICVRYARNREEAEDMLQEGFIRIFINLGKFRKEGSFEGWMRRVLINSLLESMRRKSMMFTEVEMDVIPDDVNGDDYLAGINAQDVVELIRKLPNGYRTVFNLFAVEGYSHREIAALLHISEGTSKSQYAKARKQLKKMLKENDREINYKYDAG